MLQAVLWEYKGRNNSDLEEQGRFQRGDRTLAGLLRMSKISKIWDFKGMISSEKTTWAKYVGELQCGMFKERMSRSQMHEIRMGEAVEDNTVWAQIVNAMLMNLHFTHEAVERFLRKRFSYSELCMRLPTSDIRKQVD